MNVIVISAHSGRMAHEPLLRKVLRTCHIRKAVLRYLPMLGEVSGVVSPQSLALVEAGVCCL